MFETIEKARHLGVIALERIGDYLELSPHRQGCDGFFAAILERQPVSLTSAKAAEVELETLS